MEKDVLLRGLLAEDAVNMMAISGRTLVERARELHGLSRVCTAALGRTLLISCMMGAQLKGEANSLSAIIKGGGPAGNIVCTARPGGLVKGYIENPGLELPLGPDGKLDVSTAVGWFGELTVVRDLSMKEPYVGRSRLVSGEIAEDFAQYFTLSEQQPTLLYLGVRVAPEDGSVLAAGGLLLQPLPACSDEICGAIQDKAKDISALSGLLAEGKTLGEALMQILGDLDFRITESLEPHFQCDCSRDRLARALVTVGAEELRDILEKDHQAELTCQFCNTKYIFGEEALKTLLAEAENAN